MKLHVVRGFQFDAAVVYGDGEVEDELVAPVDVEPLVHPVGCSRPALNRPVQRIERRGTCGHETGIDDQEVRALVAGWPLQQALDVSAGTAVDADQGLLER